MTEQPPAVNLRAMTDALNAITGAFRPMGDAATRAAELMASIGQSYADARLAELLGIPRMPLGGVPVHLASVMPDGEMFYVGANPYVPGPPCILLGTYREPERPFGAPGEADVADEARLIVRRGMADELEWLGQDPEWLGRSKDILDLMRSGTRARIPADA